MRVFKIDDSDRDESFQFRPVINLTQPDENTPIGDAPIGDAPIGDAPIGDAPIGDAPIVPTTGDACAPP